MQVPGQVGVALRLDALFLDVGDPLRADTQPFEGVGLKDTEGNDGCNPACDQTGEDQCPIVAGQVDGGPWTEDGIKSLGLRSAVHRPVTEGEGTRQKNRQGIDVDLGRQRHAEGKAKANAEQEERIAN